MDSRINTYTHKQGQKFARLPEIYQIELTSSCNLKCPMCLRTTDMERKPKLLDFHLLELMHERGDFAGSYYVELQMAGEPTLHPKLEDAIRFLKNKVGVLVGLSTHGLNMSQDVIEALLHLDALTISVDSVDPETYHKMRYPGTIEKLYENLDRFFNLCNLYTSWDMPFIELQLIETSMFTGTGQVEALQEVMSDKGWDTFASIRTTSDCFSEMQGRVPPGTMERNMPICLNPFGSVSVSDKGEVLSCCFIFDPKHDEINYYGNLWENSLEEIWNSDRVKAMQQSHIENKLRDQCTKCYLKSPMQIHQNIVSRLIRSRS